MSSSTEGKRTYQLAYRFFSNASFYAAGSVLIRFGSLLILPFYWGVLTPEDFGKIASVQIISQFLLSVFDLGLSGSIQRHFYEWKKEERGHHLASVWSFSIAASTMVAVIISIFASGIGRIFEDDLSTGLVLVGVWTAYFQNFGILPVSLFRIREQMKMFTLISVGQFVVQTGATVFFLFGLKMGFQGYLLGTLAGAVLYGMACLVYIFRQIRFPWKWWHLKEVLAYSLPTVPAAVLEGMGAVLDRFFLQKYVPLGVLGIYSIGRQFGMAYNFFVSMLKNSWVPLVYRIVVERKDAGKVLSRMGTYYFLVLIIPGILLVTLAKDLITVMNRPDYFGVGPFIPWFVLAVLITGVGHIHGRGLDLAKKTGYYWLIYSVQFLVNLGLLTVLAPAYGAWGAVMALIGATLAREILQIGLAYYFFPRPVEMKPILVTLLLQSLALILCHQVQLSSEWSSIIVKTVIVAGIGLINAYFVLGPEQMRLFVDKAKNRFSKGK